MIGNVLLYYNFLIDDNQEVLAEDPVSWVKSDFRNWKALPRATQTTATQNASNTTNVTPPSTTKLEDDALLT